MDPVLGIDVIIQFKKNDVYSNYACATDIRIEFEMETKSVKTIGDGNWKKNRGQSKGYRITLSNLAKFDDDSVPHAFDLWNYFDSMTPIEYRLYFTMEDQVTVKIFEGATLPITWGLGGGSEGFSTGEVVLEGDGAPELKEAIIQCEAEITGATLVGVSGLNALRIDTLSGGPITRYDFSIDGGGRTSAFVDGTLPDTIVFGNGGGPTGSEHTLDVWPVCDNGFDGEMFTIEFENLP
jgi:hypothetical protein